MDITPQSARESLDDVRKIMLETRAALARSPAGEILMLWGALWFLAFGAIRWWPERAAWVWIAADIAGLIGTILLASRIGRPRHVRSATARRLGWRKFFFWCAVCGFALLWLWLLPLDKGIQISAFITTVVMLAYVVWGLWFASGPMIALGLVGTALVVVGFRSWPDDFDLWMAFAGGGALFGTGLFLRLRVK